MSKKQTKKMPRKPYVKPVIMEEEVFERKALAGCSGGYYKLPFSACTYENS